MNTLQERRQGIDRLWEYLEARFGYAPAPIRWSTRAKGAAYTRTGARFATAQLDTLWTRGFREYEHVKNVWAGHGCATRSVGAYAAWQLVLHEFAHRVEHARLGNKAWHLPAHGPIYQLHLAMVLTECDYLAALAVMEDLGGVTLAWDVLHPDPPRLRPVERRYPHYSVARPAFLALCALGTTPRLTVHA
jgi:hypothetical protein